MNFFKNLLGGQLVKGYTTSGEPVLGVGLHKSWRVYKGKKQSTDVQVSIFHIDKKQLKSSQKDQILKSAKRQANNLAKLRHPYILSVVQPLIQDENSMVFVTQAVIGNLSTLLLSTSKKQSSSNYTQNIDKYLSSQLELKLQMFPLIETLQFMHETVKQCHLGLGLDSIYITKDGRWKIAGLNYCQLLTDGGQELKPLENVRFFDYLHCAPETAQMASPQYSKFSDSYSLGVLMANLMLIQKKSYQKSITTAVPTADTYKSKTLPCYRPQQLCQFPAMLQSNNPQALSSLFHQLLIHSPPESRLTMSSVSISKWVNDPIIITVKCLQKITQYENKQQLEFLKGLAGIVDKFQPKILLNRILVGNLVNLLKFSHLVASIIYILLDVIKRGMISQMQFRTKIWGQLKPIIQGKEMTAQSLYLIVANMEILQKYLPLQEFTACVIPLFLKCFDCSAPKLKTLALKCVQRITKKYDYQFTKTKIIPKLMFILKDQRIQMRKDALKVLHSLIKSLDAQTVVSVVLPGLQTCRKAGPIDDFINAIIIELYKKITASLSGQILATKVMPTLMPYLIDPSIQKQQFGMYKSALLKMVDKIQADRKKTWSSSQSTTKIMTRYAQNDFILEKHIMPAAGGSTSGAVVPSKQPQPQNGSSFNTSTQHQNNDFGIKFQFLNDYKQVSGGGNSCNLTSNSTNQNSQFQPQPQQSEPFDFNNNIKTNNNNGLGIGQSSSAPSPSTTLNPTSLTSAFSYDQSNISMDFTDFDSFGKDNKVTGNINKCSSSNASETNNYFSSSQGNNKAITTTTANSSYQPPILNMEQQKQAKQTKIQSGGRGEGAGGNVNKARSQQQYQQAESVKSTGNTSFGFDFGGEMGGGAFSSNTNNNNKELPFSPSTSTSKPQNSSTSIPSPKKLVGPGSQPQAKGGLRKPPKYNQFNMPESQKQKMKAQQSQPQPQPQSQGHQKTSIMTSPTASSSFNSADFNFTTSIGMGGMEMKSGIDNNDDPFADIDKQYGIASKTQPQKEGNNNNDDFDLI